MREKIIWFTMGASIAVVIEEFRGAKLAAEWKRRQADQSIGLASLAERIELLEEDPR